MGGAGYPKLDRKIPERDGAGPRHSTTSSEFGGVCLASFRLPVRTVSYPCGSSPCPLTWPRRRQPKRRKLPKHDSGPERDTKKTEILSQNHRWQRRKMRPMAERPQVN